LKVICLSVLLYITCLSNIVDGRQLKRAGQKATILVKAQNSLRSLLNNKIGEEFTINGETYVIDNLLGVVPPGVPAHAYSRYWNNAEFLRSAFLQLKFDAKKVDDVEAATGITAETYVYSDASFIAKGGFGSVYTATKYGSDGQKDTTAKYIIKVVETLKAAQNEEAEYKSAPVNDYFPKCYGTATTSDDKGICVLENAGPDLEKSFKASTPTEDNRKTIMKQLLSALVVLFNAKKSHRDIKPLNVCYLNGKVKVIDFGQMFNWGTEATLDKVGDLAGKFGHATSSMMWYEFYPKVEYKRSDQASETTQQAYLDRVKSKFYLTDLGGAFVTHLWLITKFTDQDIAGDVYEYWNAQKDLVVETKDFWAQHSISANEKAVLLAMTDDTKALSEVLSMTWFS